MGGREGWIDGQKRNMLERLGDRLASLLLVVTSALTSSNKKLVETRIRINLNY